MTHLDIAHAEIIGARAEQQDASTWHTLDGVEGGAVLVLADGLGGHESGAEASRIVVETFAEAAEKAVFDDTSSRREGLYSTLHEVNDRIAAATDPHHGQRSMASTAVAAVIADSTLRWISVGDSHLYIFRNGQLAKLNEDHSQAGIMVKSGQYQPNDEAVLNARSVLVSAITGRALEIVDNPSRAIALETGDIVLLASDGLNTLSETEIAHTIDVESDRGAEAICQALLRQVTERRLPRQDNTTVVVARVLVAEPAANGHPMAPIDTPTTNVTAPTEAATAPYTGNLQELSEAVEAPRGGQPANGRPTARAAAAASAGAAAEPETTDGDPPAQDDETVKPARSGGGWLILKALLAAAVAAAIAAGLFVAKVI